MRIGTTSETRANETQAKLNQAADFEGMADFLRARSRGHSNGGQMKRQHGAWIDWLAPAPHARRGAP